MNVSCSFRRVQEKTNDKLSIFFHLSTLFKGFSRSNIVHSMCEVKGKGSVGKLTLKFVP